MGKKLECEEEGGGITQISERSIVAVTGCGRTAGAVQWFVKQHIQGPYRRSKGADGNCD